MTILGRASRVWNAFTSDERDVLSSAPYTGAGNSTIPHVPKRRYSSERSIISSIYTRVGIDVAAANIRHVVIDTADRYSDDIDSQLNTCLLFQPNKDQGPRAFRQDIVTTMFDRGAAAIVPVDTQINTKTGKIDYFSLRVGEIKEWYPNHVRVSTYNEKKGFREDILIEKGFCAIAENPLYSVMNEPNSTLQRLIRKLHLLDEIDDATGAKKLDLIIQLPYVIKTETRRQQAEKRRKDIEFQLRNSQYGIAYTDGTEKITQLNRTVENTLLGQIESLTETLYNQLGITEGVMSGTADEETMINYYARTVEPILDSIVEAIQRSFVKESGWKKKERIWYFKEPFRLATLSTIADVSNSLSRNEILSSNEIRGFMGIPPSADPRADELRNSNMPHPEENALSTADVDAVMNEVFDSLEADIEAIAGGE